MTHFTPTIRLQNKNPCLNLFLEKGSKIDVSIVPLTDYNILPRKNRTQWRLFFQKYTRFMKY